MENDIFLDFVVLRMPTSMRVYVHRRQDDHFLDNYENTGDVECVDGRSRIAQGNVA